MKRFAMNITTVIMSCGPVTSGLAAGDAVAGQAKSTICSACHGSDGNSSDGEYPSLAGQIPGYIAGQLAKFKSGVRINPIMAGMVQTLTENDMADLDAWYSTQLPVIRVINEDQLESAKLGEKLYRGGYPPMQVPACTACHGPTGAGIPVNFPRLAGQHAEQLEKQLLSFKSEQRLNEIMSPIAFRLTATQIKALAVYLSALH